MAKEAARRGLSLLGISDHGPATPGSAGISYFKSLSHAPKNRCGITVLYGTEVNIVNMHGDLDIDQATLSGLDYAIASLHTASCHPGTCEENTQAYIYAMDHPRVKIIGHADDSNFPVDYEQLVAAAKEKDVLFELNNTSLLPDSYRLHAYENCKTLLSFCKQYAQPVLLASDSHGRKQIGCFDCATALLKETDFPSSLLLSDADWLLRRLR